LSRLAEKSSRQPEREEDTPMRKIFAIAAIVVILLIALIQFGPSFLFG
jgi:hypothetical protein